MEEFTYAEILKDLGGKVQPRTDGEDFKLIGKTKTVENLSLLEPDGMINDFIKTI